MPNIADQPSGESDADDRPWELPGAMHRDCEPHRGLLLHVCGLFCALWGGLSVLVFPAVISLALGAYVWTAANRDLKKMRAGFMDRSGEKRTHRARLCAIIGITATLSWLLY